MTRWNWTSTDLTVHPQRPQECGMTFTQSSRSLKTGTSSARVDSDTSTGVDPLATSQSTAMGLNPFSHWSESGADSEHDSAVGVPSA